jgi:hypothetical protein
MSLTDSEIEMVSTQLQRENEDIPEEDDMILSDDDAGCSQPFAPPPHRRSLL